MVCIMSHRSVATLCRKNPWCSPLFCWLQQLLVTICTLLDNVLWVSLEVNICHEYRSILYCARSRIILLVLKVQVCGIW